MKQYILLTLLVVILVGVWVNVFVCREDLQESKINADKSSKDNIRIIIPSSEFSSTTSGYRIGYTNLLLTALAITLQVTSIIAAWHKTHQIMRQTK